jgi:Ala-tRNA(Pro) deacylase
MVPRRIVTHLEAAGVPVVIRPHQRVVAAQRLAASVGVSGHHVAKSVLVDIDGQRCIAVVRGTDLVDPRRLALALGAQHVRIMQEGEFLTLFTDCEVGAEPPFGSLFGLPVVMDSRLLKVAGPLIVRAGSHEEVLEMTAEDFMRLEQPRLADFAAPAPAIPRYEAEGLTL